MNTSSHINIDIPRDTGRWDGVAAIFSSALLVNLKPKLNYNSFENISFSISDLSMKTLQLVLFVIVYQAPRPYTEFLSEFL